MCAGRLPMRKEIVWNAGMHSHPECLNKLPVNVEEQKTRSSRTHSTRRPPSEEKNKPKHLHRSEATEGHRSVVQRVMLRNDTRGLNSLSCIQVQLRQMVGNHGNHPQ